MAQRQKGSIYRRNGSWFLKYYTTLDDGKRVHKTEFLCYEKDANRSKSYVKEKRDERMRVINAQQAQQSSPNGSSANDMTVVDFWEHYLVYYTEKIKANGGLPRLRDSTMRGYKQIWKQHLKSHFGSMTLREYTPRMGTRFLRKLSSTQCKSTLKHIKALGCSIFKLAVDVKELIEVNPWYDVAIPDDAIESNPTKHYTLEEAENIISALVEHPDCQLIMALSCLLGLRPSEIVGLQWADFDEDCLHIRRAVVRGVLGAPKTKESVADIPLEDKRVLVPLELWRKHPGRTPSDWVFASDEGGHLHDLGNITGRKIRPAVKKAKLEWKGIYSGRRGAATAAVEATGGNYAVAQALLRHKSMKTTLDVYKKKITPDAFRAGMKQLAAAE
ncbi:MAG: site-specific integrase [Terriglobales bacterium]|jgi:integrase